MREAIAETTVMWVFCEVVMFTVSAIFTGVVNHPKE